MPRGRASGKLLFVVPGLTAATVGFVLQLTSSWPLVGIGSLKPPRSFEDLWAVTANADCAAADPRWDPTTTTCDPWGRPFNYPLVWARGAAGLGLGGADTSWLGLTLIGVFGLTLLALAFLTVRRAPVGAIIVLTLSAISPPSLLAMQRGNVDLLVWPWVVLALWLMSSGRWAYAAPALATAVYLKIFPLGAVAGTFGRGRRHGPPILLGLLSLTALAFEADQLSAIRRATPQRPVSAWGVSVVPLALTGVQHSALAYALGLAWIAICIAVVVLALRVARPHAVIRTLDSLRLTVSRDPVNDVVVNAGLGLLLLTYLLGSSFDYRMILLTVLVAGLCRAWTNRSCRVLATTIVALQYVSYPLHYPTELIGDFAWMVLVPGVAVVACWLWVPGLRRWMDPSGRSEQPEPLVVAD